MTIKIHGKEYKTVAERVNEFHEDNKGKPRSIITELVSWDNGIVIMKATVVVKESTFTGHAYENEGSSQINKTSALENCETSAIGRALASAGYAGSEFASANEVNNAIHQQSETKTMAFKQRLLNAEKLFKDDGRHVELCAYLEKTYGTNNIDQLVKERGKNADVIIETLTALYKKEAK